MFDADIICINVVSTSMEWNRLTMEEKAKHSHILAEEDEAKEMLDNFILKHNIQRDKSRGCTPD